MKNLQFAFFGLYTEIVFSACPNRSPRSAQDTSQKTSEEAAGSRDRAVNGYNHDNCLKLVKDFNTAIVLK